MIDDAMALRWTLLTDKTTAIELLRVAAAARGLTLMSSGPGTVVLRGSGSLLRRRAAWDITAAVTTARSETLVSWAARALAGEHIEHLLGMADQLPQGLIFDHGIAEAASLSGSAPLTAPMRAALVSIMRRAELVLAIAAGEVTGARTLVALTQDRLVLSGGLLKAWAAYPVGDVTSLTLGKRTNGETLTIASQHTSPAVVTKMGHGGGFLITCRFREIRDCVNRASVLRPATPGHELRLGQTRHPLPPSGTTQLTNAYGYREAGINGPVARSKEQP
jgi:hypothetical protein